MGCFRPLKGYRSAQKTATGKRSIVFNARLGLVDFPVDLPCGQCIGCRLERSRQWAMRCVHEASLYDRNCFITLTYRDEDLPPGGTLVVKDFQDFMKRLRKRFGEGIRFFHCGEYGEKFARPHYHACLFNFDFEDKKLWKEVRGNKLFTSEALEELWPFGFSTIGEVTFESAAYVARYITKKITGSEASAHYSTVNEATGEVSERKPEYTTMSRRPGIAKGWFDRFSSDVYPSDQVVLRGKVMKPPKYYDRLFEIVFPSDYRRIKSLRRCGAKRFSTLLFEESKYDFERGRIRDRLADKEFIQELKFKQLKRGYESET